MFQNQQRSPGGTALELSRLALGALNLLLQEPLNMLI